MEFLNVDFHLGWASWKTGMDESADESADTQPGLCEEFDAAPGISLVYTHR